MVGRAFASGYGVDSALQHTNCMLFRFNSRNSNMLITVKITFELSNLLSVTRLKYVFGIFSRRKIKFGIPVLLLYVNRNNANYDNSTIDRN